MLIPLRNVIEGHTALARLEPLALLALVELAGTDRIPPTESLSLDRRLDFAGAFVLWTYNALRCSGLLDAVAVTHLLQQRVATLRKVGREYQNKLSSGETELTVYTIAIADRRYAAVATNDKWIDLAMNVWVKHPPATFEGVTYNLAVLAANEWKRIQEPKDGAQQADPKNPAG